MGVLKVPQNYLTTNTCLVCIASSFNGKVFGIARFTAGWEQHQKLEYAVDSVFVPNRSLYISIYYESADHVCLHMAI